MFPTLFIQRSFCAGAAATAYGGKVGIGTEAPGLHSHLEIMLALCQLSYLHYEFGRVKGLRIPLNPEFQWVWIVMHQAQHILNLLVHRLVPPPAQFHSALVLQGDTDTLTIKSGNVGIATQPPPVIPWTVSGVIYSVTGGVKYPTATPKP